MDKIPPHILSIALDLCKPFKVDRLESISIGKEDLQSLCQTICNNGFSGWCANNINSFYKDNISLISLLQMLRPNVYGTLIKNQQNLALFRKMESMLAQHGIELIALKGLAVATTLYDDMSQRTIGDIDVLIHHDNVYKAHQLIQTELGGVVKEHERKTHILEDVMRTHLHGITLDGMFIELHFNLYSPDSLRAPSANIFDYIDRSKVVPVLNDTMMLFHLLSHLIKNRHDKGIRLNWIVDIVKLLDGYSGDVCSLCNNMLLMNQYHRPTMKWALQHIISLLNDEKRTVLEEHFRFKALTIDNAFIAKIGGSTKGGIPQRLKTYKMLSAEVLRLIASQHGIKNKWQMFTDICHDLRHRNH